jgi:hypothetical protein
MSDTAKTVTVCAECLTAACWQGRFYCDKYRTADVVEKTIEELTTLNLEHPDNWEAPE